MVPATAVDLAMASASEARSTMGMDSRARHIPAAGFGCRWPEDFAWRRQLQRRIRVHARRRQHYRSRNGNLHLIAERSYYAPLDEVLRPTVEESRRRLVASVRAAVGHLRSDLESVPMSHRHRSHGA